MKKNSQQVEAMNSLMEENRAKGCKCPYSAEMYENGDFCHYADCPSPKVENIPNP